MTKQHDPSQTTTKLDANLALTRVQSRQ